MKFLMLLAAGLYVAHRMEQRLQSKKEMEEKNKYLKAEESLMDETLEDSFPASDPPSFSRSEYHH